MGDPWEVFTRATKSKAVSYNLAKRTILLYSKEKEMMVDGSYYEPGKDVVTETKKKKGLVAKSTIEESLVTHGLSHVSDSSYNNLPEIKSVKKCELFWPFDQDNHNKVLATSLMYPTAERSIHGLLMKEGFVKVQVDRVEESCKMLHVLPETRIEGEVECMEDTEGCFIQWPMKSLKILNTNSHGQSLMTQLHSVSTPDCRPQSLKESPTCHPPSMPSKDEIHELQRYTMALHDDQAFVHLVITLFIKIFVQMNTYLLKTTLFVNLNDNLPYSNLVESNHVCQPYKTALASVPKIKNEKVAKLLKDAEKSRPLSIYIIAQQLAFLSNESIDIIATSPLGMYQEPFAERVEIETVIQLCVNGWVDICFMHYFSMYLYTIGRDAGLSQTTYFNPRFIEGTMLLTEKKNGPLDINFTSLSSKSVVSKLTDENALIDNYSLVSLEEVDAFTERTLNGFVSTFVED
ncbi:hypothetical protein R6Q59_018122 [Mikania micrantha]